MATKYIFCGSSTTAAAFGKFFVSITAGADEQTLTADLKAVRLDELLEQKFADGPGFCLQFKPDADQDLFSTRFGSLRGFV